MVFNGKTLTALGTFDTDWSEDFQQLQTQVDEVAAEVAEIKEAGVGVLPVPMVLVEGEHYGTELPAAGTKGRLFFKVVG